MSNLRSTVLAILFPIAAFADLTGSVTLTSGTSLNLETGATAASGGDLLWNGSTLAPQGKAEALNLTTTLGLSGSITFSSITLSLFQTIQNAGFLAPASVPIGSLTMGTIVAAITNGPHDAALIVTAISGSSISLQYVTFGVTPPSTTPPPPPVTTGPSIAQVQNNYSYILPGLPNYGIAPGALFIIVGTNLASVTTPVVQSSTGAGIPTSLNGASIAVTVNGVTTHPGMYYAIATQIAAVLPSSTPVGTGTITVTYNGTTSAAAPITVLQSALGFDTYTGTGSGLGVATDPVTGNLFYFNQSAKPGQTIVLWGSGLGANPADSDTVATATPHAVNVPLKIYIGGVQAQILYQGGSGYPGVNQINVTIPQSVPTGCAVAVIAASGTISSNSMTLPIDPSGGVCSDRFLNATGQTIVAGVSTPGGNYTSGGLVINQSDGENAGGAAFTKSQGSVASLAAAYNRFSGESLGGCATNFAKNTPGVSIPTPDGPDLGVLTISGPAGMTQATSFPAADGGPSGVYSTTPLAPSFIPPTGGTYTFHATGGKDIGPFTVSVSSPSLMQWTNPSAVTTITRSQGLNLTWTGAPAGSFITVESSVTLSSVIGTFTCTFAADPGQFTVPPYILQALPAGPGYFVMINTVSPTTFTATGLFLGIATFDVGFSRSPTYN